MKIKYKDIVGNITPEKYFESCRHCCFHLNECCIPYAAWPCFGTIFEKSKSQVFEV